mgnify:CR=1 FL=1
MAMPIVWVILVNYNGSEDTIECIHSLKATQFEGMRILIVDNASEENDKDRLCSCLNDRIECLFLSENVGFGVANNMAAKYALARGAEYLLILNNDTIVSPNLLHVLHKYADTDRVLVPSIFYFDRPSEYWYAGGEVSRWKGTSVHWTKKKTGIQVGFATGCCIFLHRSIVERYGLFDENYFMYYEDTDFSIKLQQHGIPIYYISEAKIWHKVGRSSGKISGFQEYYIQRNRLYIMNKYRDYFYLRISLMYFFLTRLFMMFSHIIRGQSIKYILKGILDFCNNKLGEQKIC